MSRANLRAKLTMDTMEARAALRAFKGEASRTGTDAGKSFKEAGEGANLFVGNLRKALPIMAGIAGIGAGGGIITKALGSAADIETLNTQFSVLLGTTEQAVQRMTEMKQFALSTPFEIPDIAAASRILEVLTDGALSTGESLRMVGDAAAGSGAQIENLSMWFGRLYDGLQSGRPVGEAMMRLQELGIISGKARNDIEEMSKAGVEGSRIWEVVTDEVGRFDGMMKRTSNTLKGAQSNFKDNLNMLFAELGSTILPGATSALRGMNATLGETTTLLQNIKKLDLGEFFGMENMGTLAMPGGAQMAGLASLVGILSIDKNEIRRTEEQGARLRAMIKEQEAFRKEHGNKAERNKSALVDQNERALQQWQAEEALTKIWRGGRDAFEQLVRQREDALQKLNKLRQEFDKAETSERDAFVRRMEGAAEELQAARRALESAQARALIGSSIVGMNVGIGGPNRQSFPGIGLGMPGAIGIGGGITSAMNFALMGGEIAKLQNQKAQTQLFGKSYMGWLSQAGSRGRSARAASLALAHNGGTDGLDQTNELLSEINDKIDDLLTVK